MDQITIIQHNVLKWTSLRANELTNIYNQSNPDVILLNATGTKQNENIKIFQYNVHQKNYLNENNAGIAIAIRKNIRYKLHDNTTDDVLAVEIETIRGPVVICTLYIPPRRGILPTEDILRFSRKNIPVYIAGDLNARHRNLGHNNNNEVGSALDILIRNNELLHLGPDFKTVIYERGAGNPDILLGNNRVHFNLMVTQGMITTSDHLPVIIKISTKPIVIRTQKRLGIKKADWEKFKEKVTNNMERLNINEEGRLTEQDIDHKVKVWHENILSAMKNSIPEKTETILPHPKNTEKQKELQYRYGILKNLSEKYGWTIQLRTIFRFIQNELIEESRKNYNENWKKLIQNVEIKYKEPKTFWANIRRLQGGKQEIVPYIKDERGNKLYKDEEKEQQFRLVWSKIFKITDEENANFCPITEREVNEYLQENVERTEPYMYADLVRLEQGNYLTKPIENYHIKQIIKNFKDKAPGISGVRKSILEQLPAIAIERYKQIHNLALSMGYFPKYYKIALLCLIQKPGKSGTNPINYRPISLLEVTGKIYERILNDRIIRYLEENNKLNSNQFGFSKNKGTQTAIAKLYEIISMAQRRLDRCNVVCRDISKAFDKVWHDGVKYKLLQLNIPEVIGRTLCSFLDNRYVRIKINNVIGDQIPLKSGVPQGSIISPTLFIFYTADLPNPEQGAYDITFADDNTQIITYPGQSRNILALKTIREIKRINNYEKKWKINTNKNKFQLLSISSTKPTDIIIEGQRIPFRNRVQVLGLTIGTRGVSSHLNTRIAMANTQVNKTKRFQEMNEKIRLHLYKALIRPIMEYPPIPSCNLAVTNIRKLQTVQSKAIRAIAKEGRDRRSTNEILHKRYNIEPVNQRLFNLATRTWQKLSQSDPEVTELSEQLDNYPGREHKWWPRTSVLMRSNYPDPIYV